jgi:hypothetical protein
MRGIRCSHRRGSTEPYSRASLVSSRKAPSAIDREKTAMSGSNSMKLTSQIWLLTSRIPAV